MSRRSAVFCPPRPAAESDIRAAELTQVLISVADAMMRAPAERHQDFVMRRGIGDGEMDGEIMRAHALIRLVHQGNHHRRIGGPTDIGEGEVTLGADRLAVMIAETQSVDERRSMLDLAIGS